MSTKKQLTKHQLNVVNIIFDHVHDARYSLDTIIAAEKDADLKDFATMLYDLLTIVETSLDKKFHLANY